MYLPDVHSLAEQLRSCLQESESIPSDFTKLFDDTLFKFDTNLIPEAVALYEVCCSDQLCCDRDTTASMY